MAKEPYINLNIESNFKTISFFQKSLKNVKKYNKKNNFILFSIIFIALPKLLLSSFFIEIKVNKEGIHQILSDEYKLSRNELKISGTSSSLNTKFYNFNSKDTVLKLEWITRFSNFSYMFNNLKNITYIKINDISGRPINLSNMFRNCINIETFIFESSDKKDHNILNMENMFYNCYSLKSFSFNNFNLSYYRYKEIIEQNGNTSTIIPYYYYYNISMSYMFFNCTNLETIENTYNIRYISNMSFMFYNCASLKTIYLANFIKEVGKNIDLSYMFYNCKKLETITFRSSYFDLSDMKYMFYNCSKLKQINNINYFRSSNNLNMSYLFKYNIKFN